MGERGNADGAGWTDGLRMVLSRPVTDLVHYRITRRGEVRATHNLAAPRLVLRSESEDGPRSNSTMRLGERGQIAKLPAATLKRATRANLK